MSRIRLFAALDGGDRFWSNEIQVHGAETVTERIKAGNYDDKRSMRRIKSKLDSSDESKLSEEIANADARFVTPESKEWPHLLNDLVAPPIGLVIKGKKLCCDAIAIVGTRNPTN